MGTLLLEFSHLALKWVATAPTLVTLTGLLRSTWLLNGLGMASLWTFLFGSLTVFPSIPLRISRKLNVHPPAMPTTTPTLATFAVQALPVR
jgi:hypothetical protein